MVVRDCYTRVTPAVDISYIWTMGPFAGDVLRFCSRKLITLHVRFMGKNVGKMLPVSEWLRLLA